MVERGDIVWLEFTPTKGHEQSGRRPALVLSPKEYNEKTNLALVCPITSKAKGYPFEVPLTGKIHGVILADQLRSVDWNERRAERAGKASPATVERVKQLIELLLP